MAARPTWRGIIKLALVSIPVEIYPATKSGKSIAFHQVHEPSGQRVRYEKVVPGIGPVDRDEILKGYEVSKGEYVLLDPEEIEKVKLESRKTLELTQFVKLTDIDPIYYDKPYYVSPADDLAEEAFVVVRDALKKTGKGRYRPARHARPGICGEPETVRSAWCWRRCGMPTRSIRRRAISATSATPSPIPTCSKWRDPDREETERLRRQGVREPLYRRAQETDRGEAEEKGQADHPG